MKQGDTIKLSNGEEATIKVGDESQEFKNIYIVILKEGDIRVVDRETLTLAPDKSHDNFSSYGKIR